VSALDPTQDTARRREEREQRKAEKEWEAIGATAEKRAEFVHAIDLVSMGVDLNSENVARLIRESALVTFESPGDNMLANCTEQEKREWHVRCCFW
jgi:hypothetical protein